MGLSRKAKISVNHIRKLVNEGRIEFNNHGMDRATERTVSIDHAIYTIINGDLVDKNENLIPYPVAKFECIIDGKTLVVVISESRSYIMIRTVYWKT